MELVLKKNMSSIKALVQGKESELSVVDGKISVELAQGEAIWLFA